MSLPESVLELGPLWCHSCFAFEDANGELMNLFHGTQYIDMQIINAVHIFQVLPTLVSNFKEDSPVHKFVTKLRRISSTKQFQFTFLRKPCSKVLTNREKTIMFASNTLDPNICSFCFYARANVRGVLCHNLLYTRISKRNSYTVKFLTNGEICYGFIEWFAEPEMFTELIEYAQIKFAYIRKLSGASDGLLEINQEGRMSIIMLGATLWVFQCHMLHYVECRIIIALCA